MECIEVIKTKDGLYFEDERKALAHCENRFGEELDGLFKQCHYIGLQARVEIMQTIIAKPKEFELLAGWIKEYHQVKQL